MRPQNLAASSNKSSKFKFLCLLKPQCPYLIVNIYNLELTYLNHILDIVLNAVFYFINLITNL